MNLAVLDPVVLVPGITTTNTETVLYHTLVTVVETTTTVAVMIALAMIVVAMRTAANAATRMMIVLGAALLSAAVQGQLTQEDLAIAMLPPIQNVVDAPIAPSYLAIPAVLSRARSNPREFSNIDKSRPMRQQKPQKMILIRKILVIVVQLKLL